MVDDYAYIPSTLRAKVGRPDDDRGPASYDAAVQFACQVESIDEPTTRPNYRAEACCRS